MSVGTARFGNTGLEPLPNGRLADRLAMLVPASSSRRQVWHCGSALPCSGHTHGLLKTNEHNYSNQT